ncbi:MAG: ABC transporter permease [Candidatus Thermoplasmatota archaeon]|nr:ABC transporter permease [Candidatus Thermoplasmatota archaeon]
MTLRMNMEKEIYNVLRDWKAVLLSVSVPVLSILVYSSTSAANISYKGFPINPTAIMCTLPILFSALFVSSSSIVREKMMGTLSRLAKTPLSSVQFLLSKLVANSLVSVIQAVLLVILASELLSDISANDAPMIFLIILLLAVVSHAIGLLISAVSSTDQQALSLMCLYVMMTIVLSGIISIGSMPAFMTAVSNYSPYTHAYQALKSYIDGNMLSTFTFTSYLFIDIVIFFAMAWIVISASKR